MISLRNSLHFDILLYFTIFYLLSLGCNFYLETIDVLAFSILLLTPDTQALSDVGHFLVCNLLYNISGIIIFMLLITNHF